MAASVTNAEILPLSGGGIFYAAAEFAGRGTRGLGQEIQKTDTAMQNKGINRGHRTGMRKGASMRGGAVIRAALAFSGLVFGGGAEAGLADFNVGAAYWAADSEMTSDTGGSWHTGRAAYGVAPGGLFVWGEAQHAVPVLPNIRLRGTLYHDTAGGMRSKQNHLDVIGYWNAIDLTPVSLRLGIGAKAGDMSYRKAGERISFTHVKPFVYGRLFLDVPGTGLSLGGEAEAAALPHNHQKLFDGLLGADWNFGGTLVSGGAVAGYRYLYLREDYSGSLTAATRIRGPYAGLYLSFL